MKTIKDAIRCNLCRACAVDGGHEYLRRSFKSKDCFTELSVCEEE